MIVRAVDGRFHVAGLAPGDYTLLAWPDGREVEYRNPAVLGELLPHGTAVLRCRGRAAECGADQRSMSWSRLRYRSLAVAARKDQAPRVSRG